MKKRDILFFVLGMLALFALEVAFNFEAHKAAFLEGYNESYEQY